MVADEPVRARAAGPAPRAADRRRRASCATSWPRRTTTTDAASCWSRVAGGYRFQSHPDLAPYVERFVLDGQSARLSAAALETLAIVAYKQPISRAQVAAIRGVDVDGVLRTLQQRGYIDEVGRDPGPGPGGAVRHDAVVPRAARPRLARRPAAARRLRPRRRRRRGARDDAAACGPRSSRQPPPGAHCRRRRPRGSRRDAASGCRRSWPSAGSAAGGSCEELIAAGRVTVNGEVAVLGRRVDPEQPTSSRSTACRSASRPGLVHYLLNKPRGRGHDGARPAGPPDRGRPRARRAAGVPGRPARRRHRGPAAAHQRRRPRPPPHPSRPTASRRSTSPRSTARPSRGSAAHAARRRRARRRHDRAGQGRAARRPNVLRITIHEGRNRQVRRMCEAVGHPVRRLVRTRIGPLSDRTLKPGAWRELTPDEVRALERAVGGQRPDGNLAPPCLAAVRALRGATTVDDDDDVDHMHERGCTRCSTRCSSATASTTTTSSASSSPPPTTSTRCSRPPRPATSGSATCR